MRGCREDGCRAAAVWVGAPNPIDLALGVRGCLGAQPSGVWGLCSASCTQLGLLSALSHVGFCERSLQQKLVLMEGSDLMPCFSGAPAGAVGHWWACGSPEWGAVCSTGGAGCWGCSVNLSCGQKWLPVFVVSGTCSFREATAEMVVPKWLLVLLAALLAEPPALSISQQRAALFCWVPSPLCVRCGAVGEPPRREDSRLLRCVDGSSCTALLLCCRALCPAQPVCSTVVQHRGCGVPRQLSV